MDGELLNERIRLDGEVRCLQTLECFIRIISNVRFGRFVGFKGVFLAAR
jgi:hypothetical protein